MFANFQRPADKESASWGGCTPMPPSIEALHGRFRLGVSCLGCTGLLTLLSYQLVPCRLAMMPWGLLPPLRQRRSRYLSVARRSVVACAVRRSGGSPDFSRPGRAWSSRDGIQFFAHSSMLRNRGAGSMSSRSAFPIGSRHPDLARPQQSRSFPLPATAVTRSDHAQHPFQGRRCCGDLQSSFDFACHTDSDPDAARDRVSASAPSTGFRSHFKIDALAAHSGAHFSGPGQALAASDRLARRRYPPLDRAAGGSGLITESNVGDWLVAAWFALLRGRYRSTAQHAYRLRPGPLYRAWRS